MMYGITDDWDLEKPNAQKQRLGSQLPGAGDKGVDGRKVDMMVRVQTFS